MLYVVLYYMTLQKTLYILIEDNYMKILTYILLHFLYMLYIVIYVIYCYVIILLYGVKHI